MDSGKIESTRKPAQKRGPERRPPVEAARAVRGAVVGKSPTLNSEVTMSSSISSRSILSCGFVLGSLLLAACSSDDDDSPSAGGAAGSPQTTTNPNQPSAGGSASTGAAGAAGTTGSAGARSGETNPGDVGLNQGGSASTGAGAAGAAGSSAVGAADAGTAPGSDAGAAPAAGTLSFFVTSRGVPEGANFGGLDGADALCDTLATAVSAEIGAKTWRAYLSTTTVNARDRIGTGPWFNAAGVLVANNVTQLHDQAPGGTLEQTWAEGDATIALDELGNQVPAGNPNVQHDILTGTLADGTVAAGLTCGDWTAVTGNVEIGHSNRAGGGAAPESWSSAHGAPAGCAPIGAANPNVSSGGGRGSIYCFAAD